VTQERAGKLDRPVAHVADAQSASARTLDNRMASHEDLISRLKEMRPQLRPAERRVADVVLSDVEFAVRASNANLAQKAGVSEPTVTRFCRALGCEGVRDFKLRLAQSLVVGAVYFRNPPDMPENSTLPYWSSVFHHAGAAIALAQRQLDEAKIRAAVDILVKAKRILVFGVGGGATMLAQDTQYRLFRYGLSVAAYSDTYLMRMVSSTLGPDDAVIAISATGRTPEIIDSVLVAQQYRAQVVAFTTPGSKLDAIADVALSIDVPESSDVLKPTASRYAFMVAIDLVATGIAYQLGLEAQENLRRIKYNLLNLREGEVLEPLGD
jgi:DNA-binding MurR/RpiR family transcriptional regulator